MSTEICMLGYEVCLRLNLSIYNVLMKEYTFIGSECKTIKQREQVTPFLGKATII